MPRGPAARRRLLPQHPRGLRTARPDTAAGARAAARDRGRRVAGPAGGHRVDAYGGTDQVMVYAPGTPFSMRGHWGSPEYHPHHVYRVQRPLRVYPGFWFATGTQPTVEEGFDTPQGESMGFYLVDSIADLVRSGVLAEMHPLGKGRWRGEWR
ncbi:glycohydrolase toxin TNT-related protein [Thermomonospora amylolytica]|uniref:glycohydrolase toxin TNT-related protein n=1 Tax=Thermomonospora amylolytica TaxID=1411117 RepID=UPI002278D685|nr:glycohydrolase toxin TNT-related protein [Thermomonospora amylolytica]